MIVTLEEVKKNRLENIEKYFSKETVRSGGRNAVQEV
jgi:hypothetical protein